MLKTTFFIQYSKGIFQKLRKEEQLFFYVARHLDLIHIHVSIKYTKISQMPTGLWGLQEFFEKKYQ